MNAMGAVITQAANCRTAAITTCMQRFYAGAVLGCKAQFPERAKAFDSETQW